jgi:hypothetical protein
MLFWVKRKCISLKRRSLKRAGVGFLHALSAYWKRSYLLRRAFFLQVYVGHQPRGSRLLMARKLYRMGGINENWPGIHDG